MMFEGWQIMEQNRVVKPIKFYMHLSPLKYSEGGSRPKLFEDIS